jgi:DNA-binding GntR family transcriptional regulator
MNDRLPPASAIDRTSYVPMFRQLATLLEQAIAAGDIRAGLRLPSETELCERYGMSRMTVRRAIAVLIEQGLARAERGRGVFVEPLGLPAAQFGLAGLRELFGGDNTAVEVLEAKQVRADARLAEELEVKRGIQVVNLRRRLTREDKPIAYHDAFLVNEPALLEAERSFDYLQAFLGPGALDSPYRSAIVELQVTNLTETQAVALERKPGEAAWVLEHTFFAADGSRLSWGFIVLPSDMLHFPTRIGLTSEAMGQAQSAK